MSTTYSQDCITELALRAKTTPESVSALLNRPQATPADKHTHRRFPVVDDKDLAKRRWVASLKPGDVILSRPHCDDDDLVSLVVCQIRDPGLSFSVHKADFDCSTYGNHNDHHFGGVEFHWSTKRWSVVFGNYLGVLITPLDDA